MWELIRRLIGAGVKAQPESQGEGNTRDKRNEPVNELSYLPESWRNALLACFPDLRQDHDWEIITRAFKDGRGYAGLLNKETGEIEYRQIWPADDRLHQVNHELTIDP